MSSASHSFGPAGWSRRQWLKAAAVSLPALSGLPGRLPSAAALTSALVAGEGAADSSALVAPHPGEGLVAYVQRVRGGWDGGLYAHLLGAANAFKEGDELAGLAAFDEAQRQMARDLLAATPLRDLDSHPPLDDGLLRALRASLDPQAQAVTASWTLGNLKAFLLNQKEPAIQALMPGLSSDVIGCLVKLMTNDELQALSAKIFNPLPRTQIGARGYLGARIQPNSPTDNPEDIRWQVLDGWAYAVGDVVLGTNPVSSAPEQVVQVERTLQELLRTFGLEAVLPHCVLAHIDVQAEVERRWPGTTALWFQSIAGSDAANRTFDLTLEQLLAYADQRQGRYAFYFETGQGADCTNGHAQGMDMVLHEARKYGLARLLSQRVALARGARPWLHLNDVAGFIGPEVFRTRDQLVRCCLEDLVMGKLHGLCIGLDICTTLHMEVSLDDLDVCLAALAPAQPAYLMALPTKIDPMLGYLTTGFQDHVRLRQRFGCRVDERMAAFFRELGVIDAAGQPGPHFGDPLWVYLQYRRRQGDDRAEEVIQAEGRAQMAAVRGRGVFLAAGHGVTAGDLTPELEAEVRRIYADAKLSIWAEFTPEFRAALADQRLLFTRSRDRRDYILHPTSGEVLDEASLGVVQALRQDQAGRYDVQLVISDGLNALAISDLSQLLPFRDGLRARLTEAGYRVAPQDLVVERGRVRAGYRIGERLFSGLPGRRAILHLIGERPGTGHRTFSVYLSAPAGAIWGMPGRVDHDITRVVAGIANTALIPARGVEETVRLLNSLWLSP